MDRPDGQGGGEVAITVALAESCRGFSCPQEHLDEQFLQTIACEYARGVTERFLNRFGPLLDDRGRGIPGLIHEWFSRDLSFDEAWEPIFGTLGEVLAGRSPVDPLGAGARLGLTIQEHGVPGSWTLSFDSPVPLRWGRWPLPATEMIAVSSDGQLASIETGLRGTRQSRLLRRTSTGSWECNPQNPCPQVTVETRKATLLLRECIQAPEFVFLQDELAPESSWLEIPARCSEAVALLRQYAPEYLRWIDRVMRYIIPLRGGPGRIVSGSTRGDSGVSHISSDASAPELAEMLVHESAHQYYYLVTRLQPVDDGSDLTLYYSPIKACGRPIHYIHLAYHAFANVLLLGRVSAANGFPDPTRHFARNEEQLLPQLEQLEKALNETDALTTVGFALWQPLSERLRGCLVP
jgi:hypothetical protein